MTKELSQRIEAARATLDYHRQQTQNEGNDLQESAIDLVADLQHLLTVEDIDVVNVFNLARSHYQVEKPKTYEGWNTYETWAVSLWLNNDWSSYSTCRSLASEARRHAVQDTRVTDGLWTAKQAARSTLAQLLQELVEEGSPLTDATLYSDLIRSALSEVDWSQIAESLLEED